MSKQNLHITKNEYECLKSKHHLGYMSGHDYIDTMYRCMSGTKKIKFKNFAEKPNLTIKSVKKYIDNLLNSYERKISPNKNITVDPLSLELSDTIALQDELLRNTTPDAEEPNQFAAEIQNIEAAELQENIENINPQQILQERLAHAKNTLNNMIHTMDTLPKGHLRTVVYEMLNEALNLLSLIKLEGVTYDNLYQLRSQLELITNTMSQLSGGRKRKTKKKYHKQNTTKKNPIVHDLQLYKKIKKKIYKNIPKHSAYRSGLVVKTYKKQFQQKHGNKKQPYIGTKKKHHGLSRWFKEKWKNQRGNIGYKFKNDVYRPTIRITDKTPITFSELKPKEIKKARQKKYIYGRVDKFRNNK
tara:strand:- start:23218 stop:24291 length:1074 start_codon:yes stop_codon:yes gene_type:complete